jgi:TRAP-type C4-dicarboxylate transport system permease small subunit
VKALFFKSLERINATLLFVMFAVTLFQVIARMVLRMSSVWSEELARLLYVCIVFLGAAIITKEEEHISIIIFQDRLPAVCRHWLYVITRLVMLPFTLVLICGAFINMKATWEVYASTMDWISMGYVYLVILISGVLMFTYIGKNLLRCLAEIRSLRKAK